MAIVSAAIAIGNAVLGFLAIQTSSLFVIAAVGFLTQAAIGLALNALTPKPKVRGANRGYQVSTRGSALDHQIIYGRMRTGGVIVFDETTGVNNLFLHRIIAFAGHEVESFDEVYIDDEVLTLDTNGEVTAPAKYAGKIRINEHLGAADQLADADLVSESPKWTAEHRLRGIAYLYIRLQFDQNAFPNGVPDITATIKGKKVYDPRTETTAWSDNPALCLRDYLSEPYGLAEESANIDDEIVSDAANVCDELVERPVNTMYVGGEYKIKTVGTTDFTLYGSPNNDVGTVFTATSVPGAESGAGGTGTIEVARYTCNGAFVTQSAPVDMLNDMLTSMGGLLWYAQGEWRMKPAYYVAPTLSFDEDDLRSNIAVKTRHSRRDNFNTVKGTFRGEESNWQVTDYPEVSNAAFVTADNNQESVLDLELPFTDNADEARRIARIVLERNRQQLTVSASFGLRAFQVQTGDIINLTIERFGWTNKEFEVTSWTFGLADNQDLQVQMTLREISESVFDEVDDGVVYERDNTTLLSPFEVPAVGFTEIVSETKVIQEKLTNVVSFNVSSGRPEGIDLVEVQFRKSSDTEWSNLGTGELGKFEIVDLEAVNYDFRARPINTFGVKGDWEFQFNVSGAKTPGDPSDVSGLTAEVNGATIHLEWEPIPDLDLSYYRIRHSIEEASATWANATTAVDKIPRPATAVSLPARPGTYHIRAVNKSGNSSTNYTSIVVPEANLQDFANTDTQTEDPTFSGTKTGCSVVSSALEITDVSSAPSTATYDFSTYIDTGSVRRVRSRIEANVERDDKSAGLFDDLPGLFDSLPGLFDDFTGTAQFADTNVQSYISITQDDPAGSPTWSDYQLYRAGEYSGRAFRFRVILSSTSVDVTPSITGLKAIVEYD